MIILSLGEPSGWTASTVALVVDRIAASGVVVTVAVGDNVSSTR